MPKEFGVPEPGDILKRILASGRTPQQFAAMNDVIYAGRENGTIRSSISCWEHREQFFEMADRVYVKNGKAELKDAEAGMHEGQCKSPICLRLARAYFETLSPSTEEQSEQMREFLVGLRKELITGREIGDLKGKPSRYSDSITDNLLIIDKAVDISHLCQCQKGDEARLTYYSDHGGPGVRFSIRHTNGVEPSIFFYLGRFQPDEIALQAEFMGIDPKILHEIVYVNAPNNTESTNLK